jgi:hypothetical protein
MPKARCEATEYGDFEDGRAIGAIMEPPQGDSNVRGERDSNVIDLELPWMYVNGNEFAKGIPHFWTRQAQDDISVGLVRY